MTNPILEKEILEDSRLFILVEYVKTLVSKNEKLIRENEELKRKKIFTYNFNDDFIFCLTIFLIVLFVLSISTAAIFTHGATNYYYLTNGYDTELKQRVVCVAKEFSWEQDEILMCFDTIEEAQINLNHLNKIEGNE